MRETGKGRESETMRHEDSGAERARERQRKRERERKIKEAETKTGTETEAETGKGTGADGQKHTERQKHFNTPKDFKHLDKNACYFSGAQI